MAAPTPQDQVEIGLGLMLSQWEDKPLIRGLFQSYLENIQNVEDLYEQMMTERDIYSAIGFQLDVLGALVGEPRQGREDEPYRQAILNRVLINNSSATPEGLIEILKVITNTDNVKLWEHYPATVYMFSDGDVSNSTAYSLEQAGAAGVILRLIFENPECRSFIPSDLFGDTPNLIENNNNNIVDDNLNQIVVNALSELTVNGDRSFLPELGESSCINPLADIIPGSVPTIFNSTFPLTFPFQFN